jgi:hypothetical protein
LADPAAFPWGAWAGFWRAWRGIASALRRRPRSSTSHQKRLAVVHRVHYVLPG